MSQTHPQLTPQHHAHPSQLSHAHPQLSHAHAALSSYSAASSAHFPQSQTALAYTGVSLNKQLNNINNNSSSSSSNNSNNNMNNSNNSGAGSLATPMAFPTSLAQYQQYLNPYYGLVGAQSANHSAAFTSSPYNQLVAMQQQQQQQQQSQLPSTAAQQLAALQGLQQSMNPLAGFLPPNNALGMLAAGLNPMSSMSHFNPALMPQYMALGGVAAANLRPNGPGAAAAAAAAAAAMANAGLQPFKKMRTI